jgi:DNA-binding transcriptional MerR regulator
MAEEKLFYTIGEASQMVDVKPYVLRYWETEFKKLNPQKSETGQRTYRKKDIQVAMMIKKLLYDEQYTIAGAIKKLEEIEKEGLDQMDIFHPKESAAEPAKVEVVETPVAETAKAEAVEPVKVAEPAKTEVVEMKTEMPKEGSEPEAPVVEKPKRDQGLVREYLDLLAASTKILKKYELA